MIIYVTLVTIYCCDYLRFLLEWVSVCKQCFDVMFSMLAKG